MTTNKRVGVLSLPRQVRLNGSYDIKKLQLDLTNAEQKYSSLPQLGPYHDGSWTGIALRNANGDYKTTVVFGGGSYSDTEVLASCPYFKEIISNFPFTIGCARLLFVPPGKKIGVHTDTGLNWDSGAIRIHIPIVTNENVKFYIEDEQLNWKEGELWYGDFSLPHKLHNQSDITRVHLVLDCLVDNTFLALFPAETIAEIERHTPITRHKATVDIDADIPLICSGYFRLPKQVSRFPLFGEVKVNTLTNQLIFTIFGFPLPVGFHAIEPRKFESLGYEITLNSHKEKRTTLSIRNIAKNTIFEIELHDELGALRLTYIKFQKTLFGFSIGLINIITKTQQYLKRVTNRV